MAAVATPKRRGILRGAQAPFQPGDDECSSVPHDYAVREETR